MFLFRSLSSTALVPIEGKKQYYLNKLKRANQTCPEFSAHSKVGHKYLRRPTNWSPIDFFNGQISHKNLNFYLSSGLISQNASF